MGFSPGTHVKESDGGELWVETKYGDQITIERTGGPRLTKLDTANTVALIKVLKEALLVGGHLTLEELDSL